MKREHVLWIVVASLAIWLLACTATLEPTALPTPTPTSGSSPTPTSEISPLPTVDFVRNVTPELPRDFVDLPVVSVERHYDVSATDVVTFSINILCDGSIEFDPEEIPAETFVGIMEYELIAMYKVKHDGVLFEQGEFNTGLGPYSETEAQPGPCVGVFATLHISVDRYDYPFHLYTVWAQGRWEAPEQYELDVYYFQPDLEEVIDEDNFWLLGSFWGMQGRYPVYLPVVSQSGKE